MINYFANELNRTYSVYPKLTTLDVNDEVQEGYEATATIANARCAFYVGAYAETLISDRYKTKIDGVIIADPDSVPEGAKIVLDDGKTYYVIYADNIMSTGDVMTIGVQVDDNV